MKSFVLKDGDIVIEKGEILMVEGQDELVQSVQIGLGTNKGEWFLNLEEGVDYLLLVDKTASEAEKREEIYNAVMKHERVRSVESIDFNFNRSVRTLSIFIKATSTEGETITSEVVFGAG